MDPADTGPILETNPEDENPSEEKYVEEDTRLDIDDNDEDYDHLILKPNHFQIGINSKGKYILKDVNFEVLINQHLDTVINEAYKLQSNWTLDEHNIKISILLKVQDTTNWYKEPPQK